MPINKVFAKNYHFSMMVDLVEQIFTDCCLFLDAKKCFYAFENIQRYILIMKAKEMEGFLRMLCQRNDHYIRRC